MVVPNCSNGANWDFCVARLSSDGSLDASFDGPSGTGNGTFLLPIGTSTDQAYSAAVQPDGKLVLAGSCSNGSDDDFCAIQLDSGGQFDDYATGGGSDRDFASAASTSFFGACLRGVGGSATATWASTGSCLASDGPTWNAIPAAPSKLASTPTAGTSGTAHLRFGLRAASAQPAGGYIAPVTFDVLAPGA